jgi:hypothetical protein
MNELQHVGAFVIQFRAGTDFSTGQVSGRIEHVASGRSGRFESAAALLDLLAAFLKRALSPEPAPSARHKDKDDVEA